MEKLKLQRYSHNSQQASIMWLCANILKYNPVPEQ